MADGISNENFREEMLRLMKSVVIKVGENAKEIDLLKMLKRIRESLKV